MEDRKEKPDVPYIEEHSSTGDNHAKSLLAMFAITIFNSFVPPDDDFTSKFEWSDGADRTYGALRSPLNVKATVDLYTRTREPESYGKYFVSLFRKKLTVRIPTIGYQWLFYTEEQIDDNTVFKFHIPVKDKTGGDEKGINIWLSIFNRMGLCNTMHSFLCNIFEPLPLELAVSSFHIILLHATLWMQITHLKNKNTSLHFGMLKDLILFLAYYRKVTGGWDNTQLMQTFITTVFEKMNMGNKKLIEFLEDLNSKFGKITESSQNISPLLTAVYDETMQFLFPVDDIDPLSISTFNTISLPFGRIKELYIRAMICPWNFPLTIEAIVKDYL